MVPQAHETKEDLLQKGINLLESQNNDQALAFFEEALKRDPESVRAISDKGIIFARQGKFEEAKKLFDTAISISEKKGVIDYRPIVNAGIVLSIYGDPVEAIQYFDRVLNNRDKAPKDAVLAALVNKGVTLFEDGKYEESITYFDQALAIEPNRLGALVNKANALQELGEYKEALKYFERAYDIDKDPLSWKPRYVIVKTLAPFLN